jgi:cell division protein FtsI (penicillin-binding protein 3)
MREGRITISEGPEFPGAPRVHLEGTRKQALETGRNRLLVTGVMLALAFLLVAGRLTSLALFEGGAEPSIARAAPALASSSPAARQPAVGRADIVDRNGIVLATSLPTASLYADPSEILDADEAARRLGAVLPDIDVQRMRTKLASKRRFAWLRRNLTPKQQHQVNRLGIPGIYFRRTERRIYPHGAEAAHILGLTDVDGNGIAGIEGQFDRALRSGGEHVALSIDLRLQAMLRDELVSTVADFRALGAAGVILDVHTGEVMALVSLPDFDPNDPTSAKGEAPFNRVTKGVYELGSIFKLLTAAMALDSGTVTLRGGYDASKPIRIARFTITDYHPKNRWLSVPEILVHSSNIGAAKMALDVGTKTQREYLKRFGLLRPATVELPEVGTPLAPSPWREINTMTISYGHGIAVSPLQMVNAVATVVNGGLRHRPTIIKHEGPPLTGTRILSERTSRQMRGLMNLVVSRGTGKNARVPGYRVGGKTGTAEKAASRGYRRRDLISSFVAAFPIDDPKYAMLILVDEPKGNKRTYGYATGGWVAAPAIGRMVRRMAPLMGIAPATDEEPKPGHPLFVSLGKRRHAAN